MSWRPGLRESRIRLSMTNLFKFLFIYNIWYCSAVVQDAISIINMFHGLTPFFVFLWRAACLSLNPLHLDLVLHKFVHSGDERSGISERDITTVFQQFDCPKIPDLLTTMVMTTFLNHSRLCLTKKGCVTSSRKYLKNLPNSPQKRCLIPFFGICC